MNLGLTTAVKVGLLAAGWYAYRLRSDALPGVLVLCYHGVRSSSWQADERAFANLHIDAEVFDGHCRVLAETCHPISLDDWRAALARKRRLPKRPVHITFDDGYRSVHDLALPIVKRHGLSASVFVCSEPVRTQRLFWFDALARRAGEPAVRDRLHRDAVAAARGLHVDADPGDPLAPMTVDHVRSLAANGIEIGVHTARHVPLVGASVDDQREEIASCRDALAEWTGKPVRALAYPWGRPGADYTSETVRIAADLGFDFAFSTQPAFAIHTEPALERSRFLVLAEVQPAELAHRIAYAWR